MARRIRSRRTTTRTAPGTTPKESVVQAHILDFIGYHQSVAWAERTNTGGARLPGKGRRDQYVRFLTPGWPDITGQLVDGRSLFIEVKRPGGKPTPEQKAFIATVTKQGGCAFVADSVDVVARHLAAELPIIQGIQSLRRRMAQDERNAEYQTLCLDPDITREQLHKLQDETRKALKALDENPLIGTVQ